MVRHIDPLCRPLQLQGDRVQAEPALRAGLRAYAPRQCLYGRAKFFHRGRLGQVDVGTAAVAAHSVVELGSASDHDDADARVGRAYAPRQAESVFAGQIEVQHQQVGPEAAQLVVQRFGAINASGVMTHAAQRRNGGFTQVRVVFDDNNVQRGIHSSNLTLSGVGR